LTVALTDQSARTANAVDLLDIDGSSAPTAGFAATVDRVVTATVMHTNAALAGSSNARNCRGWRALPAVSPSQMIYVASGPWSARIVSGDEWRAGIDRAALAARQYLAAAG